MKDEPLNEAERRLQPPFSLGGAMGAALILLVVMAMQLGWDGGPNRFPLAARTVPIRLQSLSVDPRTVPPLTLVGHWRMTAPDPRFGGLSALAIDRGQMLAQSDSGIVMRFPQPGRGLPEVSISELPGGPGSPRFKVDRDSESLARDSLGRGWWTGFETANQLWLYDRAFQRPLARIDFGAARWPNNLGVEAMLPLPGGRLMLVPELAHEVVTVGGGKAVSEPLTDVGSSISDMVRLPDGEVLVLLRSFGLTGFHCDLGALVRSPAGWTVERRIPLALGIFANWEGLAAEPLANGRTRLWLVTDDNFQPPMTTDLVALDVPSGPWRGAP